jgi:hypothetical protein
MALANWTNTRQVNLDLNAPKTLSKIARNEHAQRAHLSAKTR